MKSKVISNQYSLQSYLGCWFLLVKFSVLFLEMCCKLARKKTAGRSLDVALCGFLQVFKEGIAVKFMSYRGTIHRSHLEKSLDNFELDQEVGPLERASGKDLHPGICAIYLKSLQLQSFFDVFSAAISKVKFLWSFLFRRSSSRIVHFQLKATVIYIEPTTKAVCMSTLSHLLRPDLAPPRPFGDLTIGTIVDEAKVIKVDGERGVAFALADKVKGFAHVRATQCFSNDHLQNCSVQKLFCRHCGDRRNFQVSSITDKIRSAKGLMLCFLFCRERI